MGEFAQTHYGSKTHKPHRIIRQFRQGFNCQGPVAARERTCGCCPQFCLFIMYKRQEIAPERRDCDLTHYSRDNLSYWHFGVVQEVQQHARTFRTALYQRALKRECWHLQPNLRQPIQQLISRLWTRHPAEPAYRGQTRFKLAIPECLSERWDSFGGSCAPQGD